MRPFFNVVFACSACVISLWGCNSTTAPEKYHSYSELLEKEKNESAADSTPKDSKSTADAGSTIGTKPVADSAQKQRPVPIDDAIAKVDGMTSAVDLSDNTQLINAATEEPEIPASALAPLNIVNGTSQSDIMRVAEKNSGDPSGGPIENAAPTIAKPLPGGVKLLVAEKQFREEGPGNALRVSYDDLDLLKILNMEPVPEDAPRHFPEWLSSLNGQAVRIRGFMYPTFESSGIEQFVLARDNQICCFGRDPKVYDLIAVTLKPNATTDYIPNRPFDVVGTFRIDMLAEGGKPLGLYWLEDAQVINR